MWLQSLAVVGQFQGGSGDKHLWAKGSVALETVGQVNTERVTSCPTKLRQG